MEINDATIEVSAVTCDFLRARFRRTWQRDPTAEEEQRLVDEWVREEILFREGMALGLADDDPIVRQRIGQKLMMLADAMAPPLASEDELRAWHADRRDEYAAPAMFSFEQRFFAAKDSADAAVRAQAALDGVANDGGNPIGDATLLPAQLDAAPASYVASIFGDDFVAAFDELPLQRWVGPLISAYGAHLVYLSERQAGGPLPFEKVREEVERDWLYAKGNAARESFYAGLRANYEVVDSARGEASSVP